MKARYFYMAMLAAVLTTGFTACSDDDDVYDPGLNVPEARSTISIATDAADEVQIGVGEAVTINVTDGGGNYNVVAENPDFVTASISGNTITLTGVKKGIGGLIITDSQGNYKHVEVKCMFKSMTLSKNDVSVGMKLGHTDGVAKISVTSGNGGYTAVSANEKVATASVSGDVITIQGRTEGETTIVITDMMGLKQTVNVKVEVSNIAFSDDEKAEVLALNENKMVFNGNEALYVEYEGIYKTTQADGYVTLDSHNEWYDDGGFVMKFKGDLSVGKKTEGTFNDNNPWGSSAYDSVDYEILKNDGSRVWGICSVIKNDYLYTGYFCMPLK